MFTDYPEMRFEKSEDRIVLTGNDALNLHYKEDYILRRPIKYGHLNVSETYTIQQCASDLELIISRAIEQQMKLPTKNFKHFSCILVIPDSCIKLHVKYLMQMLFNLEFK